MCLAQAQPPPGIPLHTSTNSEGTQGVQETLQAHWKSLPTADSPVTARMHEALPGPGSGERNSMHEVAC